MRTSMWVMLIYLTTSGCSKKSPDSNEANFGLADLVGLWSVNCTASAFGQLTAFRTAAIQITESGTFIYENTHYSDETCTSKHYEESSKGSIQLGDSVDSNAKRLTITATEATAIPRSQTFVTMANFLSICGKNTWVQDTSTDLLNTPCIGWSENNSTDGINLVQTSDGKKQIQVFRLTSSGTKERSAGDDFTKD